jgi:general secretion pathway protein D
LNPSPFPFPALRPRLVVLAAAVWLAGCAAQKLHDQSMDQIGAGQLRPGLQGLRKASELEPDNARYRIDYLTQRGLALQATLGRAEDAQRAGRLDDAQRRFEDALLLDEGSERARRGLQLVTEQRRADAVIQQAERALKANQVDNARDLLQRAAKEMPLDTRLAGQLRAVDERIEAERAARERQQVALGAFKRPVTLQFRDANLKMVFEALSRTANVNIILDRDVKSDLKTTIYVKDASVEDTIDIILLQNQLEKRVLNQNTLFVYPATAPKQKEYSELKVRSFQLSNIDAAYMANVIKSLLKTKDIVTDARTNTLVMRDTAEAIAVSEKLIAANDLPDPEVMLEVEVLEVSASRLSNIGIKWPDSLGLSIPGTAKTVGQLRDLTRNDLLVGIGGSPTLALNLMLQDTATNILASPRIRARNKEKARILVGDKVPNITNLLSPTSNGGTNVISGSIQYVDVGIKLEVEPQVYVDGDVGIKINLEVSNITNKIEAAGGVAYQIGTRSAQTTLRLKDGETQVLAGLINDQDRSTASKVPGLGQLPGLGRLFSSNNGDGGKSEIVLSITPHIIRPQTLPEARYADVFSGTDAVIRERQLRLDPITTARAGDVQLPALVPATGGAGAPGGAAATAAKAGGAGGSSILNGNRPGLDPAAAAEAKPASDGTTPIEPAGTRPAANNGAAGGAEADGPPAVAPVPRRPAPPSIQPGRAMVPTAPAAPAGSAPPAPAPVPDGGG